MQIKILIVKLSSLGDILQTTFILPLLKKAFPKCQIDWLVLAENKAILTNNKFINKIIVISEEKKAWLKFFMALKKEKYNSVLIFHRSIILRFLCFLSGISQRIGFINQKNSPGLFLTDKVLFDLNLSRNQRALTLIQRCAFFKREQLKNIDFLPIYNINMKNSKLIVNLLKENYLVIAPFGGKNKFSEMPARRWPYFKELIAQITELLPEFKIYLIGSKDEKEAISKLLSFQNKNIKSLAGKINFDELAFLLKNAKLFIGNDSFPLFLAVSQSTPSLGLFGPTDAKKIIFEYHKVSFLQGKMVCSPCYNPILGLKNLSYHCPYDIQCMKSIKVKEVTKLLSKILKV